MTTTTESLKRVNVILIKDQEDSNGVTIKAGDRVMRTTQSFAEKLVASGNWAYTSKAKLHSFLNKDMKLFRNSEYVALMEKVTGEKALQRRLNGKVYAVVPTFKFRLNKETKTVSIERTTTKQIRHKVGKAIVQVIYNVLKFVLYPIMPKTLKEERYIKMKNAIVETGEKFVVVAYPNN